MKLFGSAQTDAAAIHADAPRGFSVPPAIAIAAILAAVLVAYANSLANGFAYDDWWIINVNPRLHQLRNLELIVNTPYWPNRGEELGLYRPLTVLAFAIQWVISDGTAWFFHAINLAMHAGVCLLAWVLVRRFASDSAALLGTLVFAVHPVHTEAVANIVGQAELWAALSVVGASVVFTARAPDSPLSLRRLLAIAALYAMGLFAKEHAIVLPGILGALEMARSRVKIREYVSANASWVVPSVALLAAVAVNYLCIRYSVLGSITGQDAGPQYPFLREEFRVFSALRAWPEFMRLLFFPADLSADYSPVVIMPVEGAITPMMALGALILLGLVLLAIATPWRPRAGLAAAWFFISVLPVSNLLFPIGVLLAERILYLPSVALAFAVAFFWDWAARTSEEGSGPRRMRTLSLVAAGVLVLMTVRTVVRNPDWKSNQSVVDSIIRDHPESYRAQYNAGALAFAAGDTAGALEHWRLGEALWSRDAHFFSSVGHYYLSMNRYEEAHRLLRRSYELRPEVPTTLTSLAVAELGVGNPEEAFRLTEEALRQFGPGPLFFDVRARALLAMGQPAHAAATWRTAIRNGAGGWIQWAQLARALSDIDSTQAAVVALDSAIALAGAGGDTVTVQGLTRARVRLLR